jgi:outer membrane protein, multidrug efflux system
MTFAIHATLLATTRPAPAAGPCLFWREGLLAWRGAPNFVHGAGPRVTARPAFPQRRRSKVIRMRGGRPRSSAGAARRIRLGPAVGGLCLLPTLTACIVTGYERPDPMLEVPDQYTYARRPTDAALPALDWWRGFRSRELTMLMELSQAQNLDIAAAIARIEQADAQVRVTGSALLPNVTAAASAQRSLPSIATGPGGAARGTRFASDLYNVNLTASYILDFWGKNRAALHAAEQTAIASRFDRDVITLTTLATVANTYFQVLQAQDRLRIARDNLNAANRILTIINQRFAAGTASQLDVAQQESLVATTRAAVPPLEIALQQNKVALGVLVGRAPENFSVRGGSMNAVTIPRVTPGLPSDVLNQRPDVREAEAQLASANYSVESARAAFFPNIALTGQTGYQSVALAALFLPHAWYWTVAAAVAQPLFDGFQLLGQFEFAKGRQLELIQNYRRSVLFAFRDVEQALVALEQQTIRERLQADVVRTARQAFNLSEVRLQEGTVDLVTVLAAQQTLFQGQDTLAQVRFARLQAAVSLFQALGGGWPPIDPAKPVTP